MGMKAILVSELTLISTIVGDYVLSINIFAE